MKQNLDMDCLRTFCTIIKLGSFNQAAEHLFRTAPAISLQIKRLEDQLGTKLFQKVGRNMVPSAEGENLLHKIQHILQLNDEIVDAYTDKPLSGKIAIGAIQDYAESSLPAILSKFKTTHPNVHITVNIENTKNLTTLIKKETLDIAIGVDDKTIKNKIKIKREKMIWLGQSNLILSPEKPIPLVVLEAPCSFRKAAIDALNEKNRKWEIVFTSPSLSGLKAAMEAGLGITVRTSQSLQNNLQPLVGKFKLPRLSTVDFVLYTNNKQTELSKKLAEIIINEVN